MKKRISVVVLASILILSLAGCGNTGSQQGSDSQSSQSSQVQSSTPSTNKTNTTEDFLKTITAETAEAKGVCGADLTWYYQDNVLVIKGTGDMTDYETGFSSDTERYTPWQDYEDDIGWVIIGDGCTSIGTHAFGRFTRVSRIDFPDTLKIIHEYALNGRNNLKQLILPAYFEQFGGNQEFDLSGFEQITFLGDAPENWYSSDANGENAPTIKYSGTGFEPFIEEYPNINWIKE